MRRNGESIYKIMKRRVNRWGRGFEIIMRLRRVLRGWGIGGKVSVGLKCRLLRRIRVRMRLVLVIIRIMRWWIRRGYRIIVVMKWWWGIVGII